MENRAAVFTTSSQDVEVYEDGSWRPGSLLGWRHDADGGCQAWVRTSGDGADDTAWLSLDYLRLPEPESHRRADVAGNAQSVSASPHTVDTALTGTIAAIRAVPAPTRSTGRRAPTAPTTTMNLFAVRDGAADGAARPAAFSAAGPAPAVPTTATQAAGRRRAPGTAEIEVSAAIVADGSAVPGRHRAPASAAGATGVAGRHRAADTGVWPAGRDDAPVVPRSSPEAWPAPAAVRDEESDADLFTRPMRLGDLVGGPSAGGVPQPRRVAAREGRRLTGV